MKNAILKKVIVLHGPNLNLLGNRENDIYGNITLDQINDKLKNLGNGLGIEVITRQSNYEGMLIEWIQNAKKEGIHGIIINPAAYTHTSIAIRDALLSTDLPVIEVHLSNIFTRESFRHQSFISGVVKGQITGLGLNSYLLALRAFAEEF